MKQALYRKYRPKTFKEVVGQAPIKITLQNAIAQGKIVHAYLFAGPRGIGKTSMARIFAKALNCENPIQTQGPAEPCNQCSVCVEINQGRSLDLVELDAASYRTVEEIDKVLRDVRSGSHRLPWRVFILDEAHMLSRHAFNALLKTLEEPPPRTVIILVTTEPHKLPPTVRSRTQRFDFRRLPIGEIIERLGDLAKQEGVTFEPEALKLLAVAAQGSLRDAESNLDKVLGLGEKKVTAQGVRELLGLVDENLAIKLLALLGKKNRQEALSMAEKLVEKGVDLEAFIKITLEILRRLLLVSYEPKNKVFLQEDLTQEEVDVIVKLASNWQPAQILEFIDLFKEALETQDNYPLPQMALEIALVKAISKNHK